MKIYKIRKFFLLAQAFVLFMALLYEYIVCKSSDPTFIFVYSLWNTLSYAWLFYAEMKFAPDFHPFQILTLISVQFVGLNGLSIFFKLLFGERIQNGPNVIDEVVYLGIVYLSMAHFILYSVFFYFERKYFVLNKGKKLLDFIRESNVDYIKWAIKIYKIVWLFRIIYLIFPLGFLGTAVVTFTSEGYQVVLFLLLFMAIKSPSNKNALKYHWMIVCLEIFLVLGGGMKESIIKTLIPYCIYLIITYKARITSFNKKMMLRLAFIGLFVVCFVFPYVNIFRGISIETGKPWSEISVSESLDAYFNYVFDGNKNAEEGTGTDYLMSRAGSISYNAWAIDFAKQNGHYPEFFAYCSITAIPRIIWPGKPKIVVGGMVNKLIEGDPTWLLPGEVDDYGSSATLGYVGALYFSFGLFGAIIMITCHGIFLAFLWGKIRTRLHYNFMAVSILVNIIFVLSKDFEALGDCGVGFFAVNTAYLIVMMLIDKNLLKYLKMVKL